MSLAVADALLDAIALVLIIVVLVILVKSWSVMRKMTDLLDLLEQERASLDTRLQEFDVRDGE